MPTIDSCWKGFLALFWFFLLSMQSLYSQAGCTDPLANNYDPVSEVNDGSCNYNSASVLPTRSTQLDIRLNETSGLILWDNEIWTHNDGGNSTDLFSLQPDDFESFTSLNIPGITNVDWEDIAQDDNYVYLGDFGNNANGNRTDLKVYRITKTSIIQGSPVVDVINFSYEDQTDLAPQGPNNTDFDCEAMIATDTNIYLFTKEWVSQETAVYALPKTPGTHIAVNEGSHNVNGLITGATYLDGKQLVVLSGYSSPPFLQPFVYLLYDFSGNTFFNGNKRKLNLNLPFHLVEGIASQDGLNYFASNERLSQLNIQPQVHNLDLSAFLLDYLGYETSGNAINFDDPTAWVPNVVPPTMSDIKIAHDLNLNQDYTAGSVELKESIRLTTNANFTLSSELLKLNTDSELILEPGSVLNANGDIINNGRLYFKSDAINGSAQFDVFNGIISGNGVVSVERYITNRRAYRLLSSPVTTTDFIFENWQENGSTPAEPDGLGTQITGGSISDGFDQSVTNNASMFTFNNDNSNGTADQDDDWLPMPNTNSTKLIAGEGYLTFIRGDRSIDLTNYPSPSTNTTLRATGNILTGPYTPNLSSEFENYSLVANPYQAVVNYNDVTREDLTDFIYVWDASIGGINGSGGYVSVELPSGDATQVNPPSPSSSSANQYIAPGMSFFVQNPEDGYNDISAPFNPSLTFNEVDKATDQDEVSVFSTYPDFYINSRLYKRSDLQHGNTESDAIGLRFGDSFTTLANDEDASKLINPEENYAIVNNGLRSIDKQGLPGLGHEIEFYIDNYSESHYSLTFVSGNKPPDLGVYITDKYLNTNTELSENYVYDFTVDANIPESFASDRFSLIFGTGTLSVQDDSFSSNFTLYPNPISSGTFSINTPNLSGEVIVEISSVLGQNVYSQQLSIIDQKINIDVTKLSAGIYVVQLVQDTLVYQTKLIVE